nr:PREDICTED: (E3-independent) E2 ubiquitin-conjugating enzyme isoform X2 [Latimeria chalumnae]|eukprot:XP_005993275.1 PREDICTED: (E3-independent) E2 ubiquitin-conjugating enzyme isoform X2 [Latimeria chalumnae]
MAESTGTAAASSSSPVATTSPTPSSSPGSAEPTAQPLLPAHSPAGGSQRLFWSHDVVSGRYGGSVRFGLVLLVHDEEEDSDSDSNIISRGSSDSESRAEESSAKPPWSGYVRVEWYPDGKKQDVKETKLKLEDRCVVPRDMVRRMGSSDSQCGTVIDVNIECAVKLVGSNCILYPVNSKDLQLNWTFMYGEYIVYDCWLGKIYDMKNQIILKLSNGARCCMSVDDGSKLYELCSQLQVAELKVTWIAKSFCPGGTESVNPPPSVINRESLSRVTRLGCYDHTQKQLGDRVLYTFPSKDELAHITCEVSEGNSVLVEGSVAKKVKRLMKKEVVKKILGAQDAQGADNTSATDDGSGDQRVEDNGRPKTKIGDSVNGVIQNDSGSTNGAIATLREDSQSHRVLKEGELQATKHVMREDLLENRGEFLGHSIEQDLDEDAADDTDDTSSVTSSASSTASSQSGNANRRKSFPLSIKNLKRKHKKKKTKVFREFKPGDRVTVEVVSTKTSADVMWQDGTVETNIRSNDLLPIRHLDNNEFCPGDFVVDKRDNAAQDSGVYGVIQSGDHLGRTCAVKWFKPLPGGNSVELVGEEDDVSVYDIADHPDFHFRITDIVIRIAEEGQDLTKRDEEPSVGQVARVDVSGKVEVVWADNSRTIVLPQHLYNVEYDLEESDYDSVDGSTSGATSDEWEDDSDSWETDNGLTEDDHPKTPVSLPTETGQSEELKIEEDQAQGAVAASSSAPSLVAENTGRDGIPKSFRELKEAIKILESLKNMTVEQLLTGSPTSPTVEPEKPKEKKFLDDIKKLQENLKKTLDIVAIVEEEKMEAVVEMDKKEEKHEAQTPVRSEWPSDTPVLCQQCGGKPGVTFTSAKGEVFSVLESAPDTHAFKKMEFQPPEAKRFFSTVRKEMALLATSLPDGIMVKTFEDRMDLFSALIKGPTRTPYEDGLFLFDIQLPNIYPAVPPLFHYLSHCNGRLNPNLYDNGKVCVSLLGTWIGKGTERWTSKSSLLQVLISIQGLILVNEPYYNEAGFDSDRGLQEGYENSRCYNEMALIKVMQSMTQLLRKPVEVFQQEIKEHFVSSGWRMLHRIETWLEINNMVERNSDHANGIESASILSISFQEDSQSDSLVLHSEYDSSQYEQSLLESEQGAVAFSDTAIELKEEIDNSGLGISTVVPGKMHQQPDPENTDHLKTVTLAADTMTEQQAVQPSVKPKKRRKSYRSFLPEKRGYPDIGFPLFPLSKGFIKSIRGVLSQYRAALIEASLPEKKEEK